MYYTGPAGGSRSPKADAGSTLGVVSVLEATEPPGFGPPVHVHDDAAEAFYVLDGEYVMSPEGDENRCPAGSFVFIPATDCLTSVSVLSSEACFHRPAAGRTERTQSRTDGC
jgi:cupin domain